MKENLRRNYKRLTAALMVMLILVTGIFVIFANESTKNDFFSKYIMVDGKEMHVVLYGDISQNGADAAFEDKSKSTVVMIPGLGDASPNIQFKPLAQALDTDFNVIIVEPLGYGLSEITSSDRTVENINKELNEALEALEINECILLAHSMSGAYGLNFVHDYPEKVEGFIAIDNTIYDKAMEEEMAMGKEYNLNAIDAHNEIRNSFASTQEFEADIANDPAKYGVILPEISGYTYLESDMEEYTKAFALSLNEVIRDEIMQMDVNLLTIKNKKFPDSLPVLMLVASANIERYPVWEKAHYNQLNPESPNHEMFIMDTDHYIWYTDLVGVVNNIKDWKSKFKF